MLFTLGKSGKFCRQLPVGSGLSAVQVQLVPKGTPNLRYGALPFTQITVDYTSVPRFGALSSGASQISQLAEVKVEPGVLAAYELVLPMRISATHAMTSRSFSGTLSFVVRLRMETDPKSGQLKANIGQALVKDVVIAADEIGVNPSTIEDSMNAQLAADYTSVLVTTVMKRECPRPSDGTLALSLDGQKSRSVWRDCKNPADCEFDLGIKTKTDLMTLYWSEAIYRVDAGYTEHFFKDEDPQGWKLSGCEETNWVGPQRSSLIEESRRALEIQDQILQNTLQSGMMELAENQAMVSTLNDQIRDLIQSRFGPIIIQQDSESLRNSFVNHAQYQPWRALMPVRQAVRPAVRPQQNLNRPINH
jgi:hypothetical protein